MSEDYERIQEYLERLKERYTPEELVEILNLTIEDIISMFYDEIIENADLQKELGVESEEV